LIEGSSLFTDGTAAVMFYIMLDLVKGEYFSNAKVSTIFVKQLIIGPIVGILFGVITSNWINRYVTNSILEINLAVLGAYFTF
jgi:NhaP-type Na+/H+ or K+/H+ antiporter